MPITFDTAGNIINEVFTTIDTKLPSPSPNTIVTGAKHIKADTLSKEAIEQIKQLFNAKPLVEYACHNCGAKLQLEPENHIFKCKYCGSVYMVGLDQINSGK